MGNDAKIAAPTRGLYYFRESKSFALGILCLVPLAVLYHWGIAQSGSGVRNMAEVWLGGPLHLVGLRAAHILNILLIFAVVAALWRIERTGSATFLIMALMVAEGALYATLLFKGGGAVTELIQDKASHVFFAIDVTAAGPLFLALGAGVYEELVFRLLLLGGSALLLQKVCLWNKKWSIVVALALSSLLFAGAHHIGPMGEPVESYNFIFRTVCGIVLGLVFVLRGLGVAVWTHALYNAMVVL